MPPPSYPNPTPASLPSPTRDMGTEAIVVPPILPRSQPLSASPTHVTPPSRALAVGAKNLTPSTTAPFPSSSFLPPTPASPSPSPPPMPVPASTSSPSDPFASSDGALQPPFLTKHGLLVNTVFQVLICIECQGIIKPTRVRQHFVDHHKDFRVELDFQQDFDQEVLALFPDLTYSPPLPAIAVDAVYGLAPPIANYVQCMTCCHCYQSSKTFSQHCCSRPEPSPTPTHVQRFINNPSSPWFPVISPIPSPEPEDLWVRYSQQKVAVVEPATPPPAQEDNFRIFHQFLNKQNWLERIQGHVHEDLIPLALYSSSDGLYCTLHIHLVSFFSSMQKELENHYIFRRLISTRPGEEHDDAKVRHHRSVNAPTLDAYARLVAASIAFIHRVTNNPDSPYKLSVPADISTACMQLVSSLSPLPPNTGSATELEPDLGSADLTLYDSDNDSDIDGAGAGRQDNYSSSRVWNLNGPQSPIQIYLTELLYLLFTQVPSGAVRGEFFSPLTHYILLSSLRKQKQWAPVTTITHNIAALLFAGRLTMAWKIRNFSTDKQCTISE